MFLGGLLYFYLGGWWYRVRLKWCGAQKPDAQLARRLYLYASQILAIPVVIVTVIDSFTFTTPMQAMQSDAMWQIILVIFPFWSVFASFLGARAIFDIGLFRALIWFAALPAIFYFISMGLVIVLLWFSPVFLEANITNTKHFENASFALEYPGNWDMDLSDDFHDYESLIWIDAISDAYIWFSIYEPTGSLEEEFDATLSDFRADYGKTAMTGSAANTWAGFACFGKTGSFTYEGTRYDVQIIVIPIGDEMNADIVTVWNPKMLEYTRPGFDLIERTFRGRAN